MALVLTINGATRGFAPGSLQIAETLNQRATCDFSIRDLAGNAPLVGQAISLVENGTTMFAGTIDEVGIQKEYDSSALRVLPIRCVDPNQIPDRRVAIGYEWANTRAADIVRAIITNSCGGEGLSLALVAAGTGPVIDRFAITYPTCTEALNALASLAGYRWWIDYAKQVHFENSYSNSPRWTVNNSNKVALAGTVKVRTTREKYANRVIVLLGAYLQTGLTQTFTGDGATTNFQVSSPIAAVPTVTVAGSAVTVGIADVDTGKVCYWSNGSQFVTFTTAPTAGQAIVVTYTGRTIAQVARQNDAEIAARAAAEGGTGVYTALYSTDADMSDADAGAYAASLLDQYDSLSTVLEFSTDTIAPATGDLITVSLPLIASGTFLVRSVRITDLGGTRLRRTVECVSGPVIGDAVDAFKDLAGQAVPIAPPATTSGSGSYTAPATPGVPTGLSVTVDDYGQDYGASWAWTPPSPVGSCVSYVRQYKFESWNGSAWVLDTDWGADLVAFPAAANQAGDGPWPKIAGTYRLYGRIAGVNADGGLSEWVTSAAQTITPYAAPPQPPAVTLTLAYESRSGSPYYRNLATLASAGTGSVVCYSWQFRQLNVASYVNSGSVDIDWFEFHSESDTTKLSAASNPWPVADAGKYAQVRCVPINADGTDGAPRESNIVAIGASTGIDLSASKTSSLGPGATIRNGQLVTTLRGIENGGFEDGLKGWTCTASAWTDPWVHASGSYGLRLEGTGANENGYQDITAIPGEVYALTCQVMNQTGLPLLMIARWLNNAGGVISEAIWDAAAHPVSTSFTAVTRITTVAPAGTADLRIYPFYLTPTNLGYAWCDQVRLDPVEPLDSTTLERSGTGNVGIKDGAISLPKFGTGIEPVSYVSSLPTSFTTRLVVLTTTGKTYRWNGLIYVETINATDLLANLVDGVTTAQFASSIEPVTIVDATPGSKITDANSIFNTATGKLLRWNGVAYVPQMNGADIKAELSTDKLVAGQISAGAIGTTQLVAGEILVGGGGGKPSRFRVDDASGSQIGFWGDDGAGFIGSWSQRARFGGTFVSPVIDLSSTGATIQDATFTLVKNDVTTTIDNNTGTYGVVGLKMQKGTPARHSILTEKNLRFNKDGGGNLAVIGNSGVDTDGYVGVFGDAISSYMYPGRLEVLGSYDISLNAVSGTISMSNNSIVDNARTWLGYSRYVTTDPGTTLSSGQDAFWWDSGAGIMWHVFKAGQNKFRVAMDAY